MRSAFGIMMCILLVGILGCSGVIRYEPGYHAVDANLSLEERSGDAHGAAGNDIPLSEDIANDADVNVKEEKSEMDVMKASDAPS